MTKHVKHPFRAVVRADLQDDGRSRHWNLVLECGHEDTRPVRYDRAKNNAGRGGARKQTVRSVEDAMPNPDRIRCDQCR